MYVSNELMHSQIPDEIIVTFSVSKNKFLYSLIHKNKPYQSDGKAKKSTMLSKLRYNVDLLIEELNKCDTHYVRCIKPQRLNSYEWDRDELYKQLANTGILEALPLAKCKYPIQFIYKDFFKRYNRRRTETKNDSRIACKNILESFRLTMDDDNSSVYYGKRLIFLRESMFLRLESARRRYRAECVKKIESFWIKHKKYMQRKIEENVIDDVHTININIQNKLNEKSQLEYEHVAPISGINFNAEKHQLQNIKNMANNMANNTQAIVTVNIEHEQSEFERSLLEYERIIEDCPRFMSGNYIELLTKIAKKTAYILHWLDGVNKATDTKNIKHSILEQLRDHNCDQSIDINYNNEIQLQSALYKLSDNNKHRNKWEKRSGYYNEKEDMYVMQHGTFTLFYKNGVLSRRRPARLPVRIHTHHRCLTNSHYLVHTELPQGLQDCL